MPTQILHPLPQALAPPGELLESLRQTLHTCDEDYVALLQLQGAELHSLLSAMHQASSESISLQERAAVAVVGAYLQVSKGDSALAG